MNRALEEAFGHTDGLDGIPVAGRTDWAILSDAVRRDQAEAILAEGDARKWAK